MQIDVGMHRIVLYIACAKLKKTLTDIKQFCNFIVSHNALLFVPCKCIAIIIFVSVHMQVEITAYFYCAFVTVNCYQHLPLPPPNKNKKTPGRHD